MSRITESLYRVNGVELDNKLRTNNRKVKKTLNESKKLTEDVDESTLEGCLAYIDSLIEKTSELSRNFSNNVPEVDDHFDLVMFDSIFSDSDFKKYLPDEGLSGKIVGELLRGTPHPLNFAYYKIGDIIDSVTSYLEASKEFLTDYFDEF